MCENETARDLAIRAVLRIFVLMVEQPSSDPNDPAAPSLGDAHPSMPNARAADRAWLRRWGELREWRIIVFIAMPLAPLLGLLIGGWPGWLVALGAPAGALARLYSIRCPDCGSRFAEGRLDPMPRACAVCGTAVFDNPPERETGITSSAVARVASPTADERTRRIARWKGIRKQLAAVQIVASAFGIVTLLDFVGQVRGDVALVVVAMLAVLAATGVGGLLLWRDRTGGVPISLSYYALQVVLFRFEPARLWIVLGPYALFIVGPEGPTASVGFTYGFANVEGLGRASDWVGINLLALAAFWFLWRRPWREPLAPAATSTVREPAPVAASLPGDQSA